jgi:hypothetical protein
MTEQRHIVDFTDHPDAMEMRERYARVLGGRQAVLVDGLMLLVGLYLAISPWAVNGLSSYSRLSVNNLVVGLTVALVGLALTMAPGRIYRIGWTMAAVGVWQMITPWVIGPHNAHVVWNNVCTGAIIMLLGLAATAMLMTTIRSRSRERR